MDSLVVIVDAQAASNVQVLQLEALGVDALKHVAHDDGSIPALASHAVNQWHTLFMQENSGANIRRVCSVTNAPHSSLEYRNAYLISDAQLGMQ
eukprot:1157210-Pelagomonas_calceolata.AAC.8